MPRRNHRSGGLKDTTGPRQNVRPRRPGRRLCPSCGKLRYPDHRSAVTALHRSVVDQKFHPGTCRREVRAYECASCAGHHLTSRKSWG